MEKSENAGVEKQDYESTDSFKTYDSRRLYCFCIKAGTWISKKETSVLNLCTTNFGSVATSSFFGPVSNFFSFFFFNKDFEEQSTRLWHLPDLLTFTRNYVILNSSGAFGYLKNCSFGNVKLNVPIRFSQINQNMFFSASEGGE